MKLSTYAAPLLILAADLNPVLVAPDSSGRYRVTLGGSLGQFESRQLSCSGDVLDSSPVRQRALGAEVEAWPASEIRLSGWAGRDGPDLDITTGGAQLAVELRSFGLGGGVTRTVSEDYGESGLNTPYDPAWIIPSIYLRGGSLDGVHVRLEIGPPTPFGSGAGVARLGVAGNQGWGKGLRWQAGLHIVATSDEAYPLGIGWESALPLARTWELRTLAGWRPSQTHFDGNLGLGIRWCHGSAR